MEGRYQDAVWFPNTSGSQNEAEGKNTSKLYPLKDQEVVLCEAKLDLTPELIGQAIVYKHFAQHAGANILSCVIFYETGKEAMVNVARELGLVPIVSGDDT